MKKKFLSLFALLLCCVGGWATDYTVLFTVTSPTSKSDTQNNVTVSSSNNIQSLNFNGSTANCFKVNSNPLNITSTSANIRKIVFTACGKDSGTDYAKYAKVTVSTDGTTYSTLSSGVTVSGTNVNSGTSDSQTTTDNIYLQKYGGYSTVTVEFDNAYRYLRIERSTEFYVNSLTVYTATSTEPSIDTQPKSGTYQLNASVTLTVAATPSTGECAYQWYSCEDAEKTKASILTGETSTTYSVDTSSEGVAYYFCRVSDGGSNTKDTEVATIRVLDASPVSTWDITSIAANDVKYNTSFWTEGVANTRYDHVFDKATNGVLQDNFGNDLLDGIILRREEGNANVYLYIGVGINLQGTSEKPGKFIVPIENGKCYKVTYCSHGASLTLGYAISGATKISGDLTNTFTTAHTETSSFIVRATSTSMTLSNDGTGANNAMLCKIEEIPALSGAWSRSSDAVLWGAAAPTIPTLSVTASDGGSTDGKYTVAYSLKEGSTDGIVTVDAATGITAISTGTVGSATVVATLTSTGSYGIATETVEYTVTVNARTNTATTYTAGVAAGTKAVISNAQRISDNKSAVLENVATVYDYSGSTGVQQGSTQTFSVNGETGLTGLKLSSKRRIAISPAEGVTISSVKCYVRSNSSDATTMYRRYTGASSYTDVSEAVVANSASSPTEINLTDCYQYGFAFSDQVQAVFLIEYSRAAKMGVTIKETGYATLYTDFATEIPDGVEAYYGTLNTGKDKLVMHALTDYIPANTAVILHTETPGSYTFMGTSETVDAVDGNVLEGSTTETAVAANSVYTLGMDNSTYQVGMCLYSGTSVRAYSAYITASSVSPSRVLSLSFDDEATSIKGVATQGSATDNSRFRKYLKDGRLVIEGIDGIFTATGVRMK